MFKHFLAPSVIDKTIAENKEVFEAFRDQSEKTLSAQVTMIKSIMDTRGIIEKSVSGGTLVAEKTKNGYYIYFKEKGSDIKQGGELYIISAVEKAIKGFTYRMTSNNPELPAPDEALEQPLFSQMTD